MREDFGCLSSCLHLDPSRAVLILKAELGLAMGNDAAIFVVRVLQREVELLVAGALNSSDETTIRSEASTPVDVQPRHFQYYIRTDEDMWNLFNSAFAFQVILSVFLDQATETIFKKLGLAIHSREALSACDYYDAVIADLHQGKLSQASSKDRDGGGQALTTPAQLVRVAAGVNPLCSLSPKACLMTSALIRETFMVLCEGILRSRPDAQAITVADLERVIREQFPAGLGSGLIRVGNSALALHAVPSASSNLDVEDCSPNGDGEDRVRLCVRRLQGTRTLLRKTFMVAKGSLLFTVFSKACDRLHLREGSVVFVHDGVVLSGRHEAGTLVRRGARPSVEIFAVCKTAWACKQREAARRGFVSLEAVVAGGSGYALTLQSIYK